jgi:hypothetical protein
MLFWDQSIKEGDVVKFNKPLKVLKDEVSNLFGTKVISLNF